MLTRLLHLAIGVLGVFSIYIALFLTESAEGKLQNRLEQLWVRVDDLSKAALSRQAAFLQQVSKLLGALFDRLFGVKLFSAEATATAICFSSAALCITIVILHPAVEYPLPLDLILAIGIGLLLLGLTPVPYRYAAFAWAAVLAGLGIYMDWDFATWDIGWIAGEIWPIVVVLAGAIASNILFIAASRWYLRKSATLTSTWKIVSLLVFGFCATLFLVSPLVARMCLGNGPFRDKYSPLTQAMNLLTLIGASNLITAAIPFAFVLLCLAAIAHLVLWPVLEAPIYAAQRRGLVREPKVLGAFGTMCLLFAWPSSPLVRLVEKMIHGG